MRPVQPGLGGGFFYPPEQPAVTCYFRNQITGLPKKLWPPAYYQCRLVKPSPSKPRHMQGDRHDHIGYAQFRITAERMKKQPAQRPGQLNLPVILECMDEAHQGAVILSGGTDIVKTGLLRQTRGADMIIARPACKHFTAPATFWRFNGIKLRTATAAQNGRHDMRESIF